MRITPRAEWGARSPKSRTTVSASSRRYFVVHHSGKSVHQTVRAIQNWCMDEPPHGRGFSDIDYNFLVRGDSGEIYEGRGWDVVGAHTVGFNTNGVGVCIIGTDQASDAAKASVRWLYAEYNKRCHRTLSIKGHRDLATTGTDCPGNHVYAWVHAGMPAPNSGEEFVVNADVEAAMEAAVVKVMSGPKLGHEARVTRDQAIQNAEAETRGLHNVLAQLVQDNAELKATVANILAVVAAGVPPKL